STDVAGGHEYLTLVRQEECPFWLVNPFTRPPVGVTGLPPVVPVGSDQGQDRTVVTTEGGLGGRPDQLSCQCVEEDDPATGVGHDHAVGQFIGVERGTAGSGGKTRHRVRTHRGMCPCPPRVPRRLVHLPAAAHASLRSP